MNVYKKLLFVSLLSIGIVTAYCASGAVTPTLSVSSTGTGDEVQISVTGDANASVLLFYTSTSYAYLGATNSNGTFSSTISSSSYGIAANASVFVKVGGISGSQSSSVTWPYYTNTSTTSTLTLSPSALLLNIGQTSMITASTSYLYLLSNSSPTIANININANNITVTANTYGTTTAKICIVGSTTNCASVSIVVQSSSSSQLTFSQNNFSIFSGQNATVTVSGGSGSYLISNNSNTTSVQSSISGSVVTLTATGTSGAASITVCTTDLNYCGIINANATTLTTTAITFSQTNPIVQIGQTATVTIYGGTGTNFYVSSNSNPSIVQVNINSNTLTLIANSATGDSTISVCSYGGSCSSLKATVTSATTTGSLLLSQSSVSILAGQSTAITISGGSTPYNFSTSSTNIFSGSISGNILTVYGVNVGSGTANVCASTGCVTLSITIGSTSSSVNPPTLSKNNILLNSGEQTVVYISGTGSYYVANNTNTNAATVLISASAATVYANNAGAANISICQSGGQCVTLYVTVTVASNSTTSANTITTTTTPTATPTGSAFTLTRYLGYGDKGSDVLELQQVLAKLGYLSATPNGYYGLGTKAAVKKFQAAKGIRQTGNVGTSTFAALNALKVNISSSAGASNTTQISALEKAIAALKAKIASMSSK